MDKYFDATVHATPLYSMWLQRQAAERAVECEAEVARQRKAREAAFRRYEDACAKAENRFQRERLAAQSIVFEDIVSVYGAAAILAMILLPVFGAAIRP